MQETLNDLASQHKKCAEEKDVNPTKQFAYLAAIREIGINIKVIIL